MINHSYSLAGLSKPRLRSEESQLKAALGMATSAKYLNSALPMLVALLVAMSGERCQPQLVLRKLTGAVDSANNSIYYGIIQSVTWSASHHRFQGLCAPKSDAHV